MLGDGRDTDGSGVGLCWGGVCETGGAPSPSNTGGGTARLGPELVPIGFFLDLRVSCTDLLTARNPSIASESWSTRGWMSAVAFASSLLPVSLVRAGAIGDDRRVESTVSASGGGEVWTATDIKRGDCFSFCDTNDVIKEGTPAVSGSLHDYSVHELLVPKYDCALLLYSRSEPPLKGELPVDSGVAFQ